MTENRYTVFTEGDELYEDMLDGIRNATSSVLLECYIFEPDAVGLTFIETLIDRARAGIAVRLHLDAFGSLSLGVGEESDRMKDAGIELKWFNPWRWGSPHRFNRRNHRKLLIIDGHIAWLGGFNIHEENSRRHFGEERWRDTHIRIDGPLVRQAGIYFNRLWESRRRWRPGFDIYAGTSLISNHNWLQRHQLRRLLAVQFHKARRCVWLCTPYFMPDSFLQRRMVKAARRGIEVRLLLPYKTDRPMAQWVARAAYASLMASGIRIFEYQPRVLHAKIMIIDKYWCSIGTANLDYRSFFVNYEINLVSNREELVGRLKQDFNNDIAESKEITPEQLTRSQWIQRLYEVIGWLCRRIL